MYVRSQLQGDKNSPKQQNTYISRKFEKYTML